MESTVTVAHVCVAPPFWWWHRPALPFLFRVFPFLPTPHEEELSELGRGVMLYRRLGLEFEGGDLGEDGSTKCLRLVFRQVIYDV